jgi:hypothetical protein
MALIRPRVMRRLRRKVGPRRDEGQVFIVRQAATRSRDGAGWKPGAPATSGPHGARVTMLPRQRDVETVGAGSLSQIARYLMELPAFLEVRQSDVLHYAPPPWQAGTLYESGMGITPTTPTGSVYINTVEGVTGTVEPDWATDAPDKGDTVTDGDVTWQNVGGYIPLQVVEVDQLETYELTRDVYCDLKSPA